MSAVLITGRSSGFGLKTALAFAYLDLAARAGGYEGWAAATTDVFASVAGPRPAPVEVAGHE